MKSPWPRNWGSVTVWPKRENGRNGRKSRAASGHTVVAADGFLREK